MLFAGMRGYSLRTLMKDFPTIVIVANRGHLVAYRATEGGQLEVIDSLEPMEGNEDISDLVTDQAEVFPTDGPETSGYESMPLTEELEIRSLRQVAGKIEEILEREEASSWGFASGPEISEAIVELLPDECREILTLNVSLDLTNAPAPEVLAKFEEQRQILSQPH